MRPRPALLVATTVLAACSPLRVPAPAPVAVPAPAPPVETRRETRREGGLRCLAHPRIDAWERRQRAEPERAATADSLARGVAYLPELRAILAEDGVPPELALLPVLESGFWPRARGRHGELGLWQLRRLTARRFGLVVTAARDDRLSPERATRAAARYLRYLDQRYGDWPLALAAYNAGEGRVDRALARAPRANFWQLAEDGLLPRSSRDFVPRFFAVVRLGEDAPSAAEARCPGLGPIAGERYRFPADRLSQSSAAIVSSGLNLAASASRISAALPTTTTATVSGAGMSSSVTRATSAGVTAATRAR